MALTILDNDEALAANPQSIWMQTDIDAVIAGFNGTYVVSGGTVTAQSTPDMTVAVAAGTVAVGGVIAALGAGNVTISAADATNSRVDLIWSDETGTRGITAGTAAANPKAPALPASKVLLAMVYVPTNDTDIDADQITDKRVIVPHNGTAGTLAKFSNGTTLVNSILSESGAVATVNGSLKLAELVGSELVTNGNFATGSADGWTTTGWTVNVGVDVQHDTGNTTALTPSTPIVPVIGLLYKLVYTVSSRTAGTISEGFGGGGSGAARSTNATFTVYFRTTSTANLTFTPTTDFDGHIDDVSLIEQIGGVLVPRSSGGSLAFLQWNEGTGSGSNASVSVGPFAGDIQALRNTWIGGRAGPTNKQSVGTDNAVVGYGSLVGTTSQQVGSRNLVIGAEGMKSYGGDDVIAFGNRIGFDVTNTMERTILIGHNRAAAASVGDVGSTDAVIIGNIIADSDPDLLDFSIIIGAEALGGVNAVGIGYDVSAIANTIAIGYKASTSAANDLVIGGNDVAAGGVTQAYIGAGKTKVSPTAVTWQTTGGSGTDNVGADLTLAPGRSTGNAAAGSLFFATSTPGASGVTLRALANRWKISGPIPASGNLGDLLAATDNAVNIGADAANRPKTVHVATSVIVGGNTVIGSVAGKLNAALLAIASQATGDLLYADSTSTFARLAAGATGTYVRGAGAGTAPIMSTLTLPNAATTGDTFIATGTNAMGVVAAGATGAYFRGAGAATAPIWSTLILPNGATTGDTFVASGTNVMGVVAAGAVGTVFSGGGAGVAPSWLIPGNTTLVIPGTNLTASGPQTSAFQAGGTITAGDLVILNSSSQWVQTDANAVATYNGLLGISLESKTVGQAMLVALPGSLVRNTAWAWTPGATLYLSETAATITETQPVTTDAAIRVIGHAVDADDIYFGPDGAWITHV